MNTNIVLRAALCSAVKGMDWWKNSFLFYIRFNQALANKEVHCTELRLRCPEDNQI